MIEIQYRSWKDGFQAMPTDKPFHPCFPIHPLVLSDRMTTMKIIRFSTLAGFVLLLGACSPQPSAPSKEEQRLISLYTDLLILQEQRLAQASLPDSFTSQKKIQDLLTTSGLTQQQVCEQFFSRLEDPETAREFFNRIQTEIDGRRRVRRE
ncbi:MAG: hypothetical protein V1799_03155 [bacterium]